MTTEENREIDLHDNIKQNYELLKDYENKLHYEDDPGAKRKVECKIKDIKSRICVYNQELEEIQAKREKIDLMRTGMNIVGFRELEIVTRAIIGMNPISTQSSNTDLINITDKISKNNLTEDSQFCLKMGLSKVTEVSYFIDSNLSSYPNFSQNLVNGFFRHYQILVEAGLTGDKLFKAMHNFSYSNNQDVIIQLAGLAVLTYLFERCEVFEK
jgi:hypothetical protein